LVLSIYLGPESGRNSTEQRQTSCPTAANQPLHDLNEWQSAARRLTSAFRTYQDRSLDVDEVVRSPARQVARRQVGARSHAIARLMSPASHRIPTPMREVRWNEGNAGRFESFSAQDT
jgi:hypothetical protein